MKTRTKHLLLALTLLSSTLYAQVTVFPQNKVLIGPNWWGTNLPMPNELYINGSLSINQQPASSNIDIAYFPGFNTMSIIPQWGNTNLVGIPGQPMFQVHSNEIHTMNIFWTSDSTFKTNINRITGASALNKITQLKAYSYSFNDSAFKNTHPNMLPLLRSHSQNQIGLLAQEVQEVLPEAVRREETTGQLSINYVALIPLLLESIKQQQAQIAAMQAQIDLLNRK